MNEKCMIFFYVKDGKELMPFFSGGKAFQYAKKINTNIILQEIMFPDRPLRERSEWYYYDPARKVWHYSEYLTQLHRE